MDIPPLRLAALLEQPISFLEKYGLGMRAQNIFERNGIRTVGDLLQWTTPELYDLYGYQHAMHFQLMRALQSAGIVKHKKKKKVNEFDLKGEIKMDFFEDDRYTEVAKKLAEVIKNLDGKLKVAMTTDGAVHPQSLIAILMELKENQLHAAQQVGVLSSLVKALIDNLSDKNKHKILELFNSDMEAQITQLEEIKVEKAKKEKASIIMPNRNGVAP